jgi:hypothetical protein
LQADEGWVGRLRGTAGGGVKVGGAGAERAAAGHRAQYWIERLEVGSEGARAGQEDGVNGCEEMVSGGWVRVGRAGSWRARVDAGGGREGVVRDA